MELYDPAGYERLSALRASDARGSGSTFWEYHRIKKARAGRPRKVVVMIADKLVELIELHAVRLSADVAQDLVTNERTPGFHAVTRVDLEERIFRLVHDLGDWIGHRRSPKVQVEFADWGRRRFGQGIALSEIVYAIIILKQHLRRYIQDNGLVEATFPRTETDYVLPMHLNSLQELNAQVGQFFDEALYHLAVGYEHAAKHA